MDYHSVHGHDVASFDITSSRESISHLRRVLLAHHRAKLTL